MLCPAKINLFLEVLNKRPDGYHNLESVFLAVDLCDTLTAVPRIDSAVTLQCSDPSLPTDGTNLVVKATSLLQEHCAVKHGIHFTLEKKIPMGSGLGGGSSNAAVALVLANNGWRGLINEQLAEIGAQVGSDVPFFLYGGAALCKGRGEIVTPLPQPRSDITITLVLSSLHSNTAAAYAGLRLAPLDELYSAQPCIAALNSGDMDALERAAFNRFESSVFAAMPELQRLHACLTRASGKKITMSGSGSALWFVGPADETRARIAADKECGELVKQLSVRLVEVHPACSARHP